jgi:hypothetical protein
MMELLLLGLHHLKSGHVVRAAEAVTVSFVR